tara:strand:+ start:2451 stop:2648 length:198 start_codon:yes stop_codon:yes gene_type:complete
MIDKLYVLVQQYKEKYDDFPIVIHGLENDVQDELADIVSATLQENRQLNKNEINKFQENGLNIKY